MINYIKILFPFLLLSACNTKPAQTTQTHPMINGQLETEEWKGSKITPMGKMYDLYLKQDAQYYYIGVKKKTKFPFYVDMFFKIKGELYNIHASAQLGERHLKEKVWDDRTPPTQWGYINHWTANTVLFDRGKMKEQKEGGAKGNLALKTVLPYDGFEFQFAKSHWDLEGAEMRIEMRNMVGIEDFQEVGFPEKSMRRGGEWYVLKF